jgi:hypothetical protein
MKFPTNNLYIITPLAYRKANAFVTWRKRFGAVDGGGDPAQAGWWGMPP